MPGTIGEKMNIIYPDLNGKNILITGASRGLGRRMAEVIARQGAHVIFNYRGDEQKAMALKEELIKLGASQVTALQFDVTDSAKVKSELESFVEKYGAITGLVNNAGISRDALLLRSKEEDIDATLNTNLKSAMMITQTLTKTMMKAENVSIVNISSVVGLMGNAGQSAYAASKAGLIGYTKSVAKELASRNVRCNAICPGFIVTDMTDKLDDKTKEGYLSAIPLKRLGASEEVANLVCFLLSKASGYITGETIKIDGGLYI